jgi:hypothetical protein
VSVSSGAVVGISFGVAAFVALVAGYLIFINYYGKGAKAKAIVKRSSIVDDNSGNSKLVDKSTVKSIIVKST